MIISASEARFGDADVAGSRRLSVSLACEQNFYVLHSAM
jgi:hypothetical protein